MTLILTHAAALILGVVVGYLGAYETGRIAETVLDHDDPDSEATMQQKTPTRQRRRIDGPVIAYLLGGLALVLAGWTAFDADQDQNEQDRCLADYANALADTLEDRTSSPELMRQQEAQSAVFSGAAAVFSAPDGQQAAAVQALQTALSEYQDASRDLAEQRKTSPYPDPPREVC